MIILVMCGTRPVASHIYTQQCSGKSGVNDCSSGHNFIPLVFTSKSLETYFSLLQPNAFSTLKNLELRSNNKKKGETW